MKTSFLLISFLFFFGITSSKADGDEHNKNRYKNPCSGELEERIDSIYYFSWNKEEGFWENSTVQVYCYNNKQIVHTILMKDFYTNTPILQSVFTEFENDLPFEKYDQEWIENLWKNKYRTFYSYYDNELLKELISRHWKTDYWLSRSRRIYEYNEWEQIDLVNLSVWRNETWEEFSYQDFVYAPEGHLVEMNEYYIGENEPWRRYEYSYNESGLVTERIILLRGNGKLENQTKYLYHYGIDGFIEEFIIQTWDGEKFVNNQRRIYFSSISGPRKVLVCHNGHTICISIRALPAHLAHGDHIGRCDNEVLCKFDDDCRENGKSSNSKSLVIDNIELSKGLDLKGITVYPNPVLDFVKIDFWQDLENVFDYLEINDMGGRQRKVIPVKGLAHIEINCTDLENGVYFIRFIGKELKTQKLIINR